jgi:hypothetical protein
MRALTIRQPFAAAILAGSKTVEYRSWPTNHRGDLLIHAGLKKAPEEWLERYPDVDPEALVYGAILGVVEVVDCRLRRGQYEWVLGNPRPFAEPVPCKGNTRLFNVDDATVRKQLAAALA